MNASLRACVLLAGASLLAGCQPGPGRVSAPEPVVDEEMGEPVPSEPPAPQPTPPRPEFEQEPPKSQ